MLQPVIELFRLTLAHQLGEVLRQLDRLGSLTMLGLHLRHQFLVGFRILSLLLSSKHQPGRTFRGQGLF